MHSNKRTIIEFIFIMSLLIVFGFTTFSLLFAGSQSYENISQRKEIQSDLRLASSYVNMKIRQNDIGGKIEVTRNDFNLENSLKITEVYEGIEYITWIYYDSGMLREATLEKNMALSNDLSFPIASLDGFSLGYDKNTGLIQTKVIRNFNDQEMNIQTKIKLKSEK